MICSSVQLWKSHYLGCLELIWYQPFSVCSCLVWLQLVSGLWNCCVFPRSTPKRRISSPASAGVRKWGPWQDPFWTAKILANPQQRHSGRKQWRLPSHCPSMRIMSTRSAQEWCSSSCHALLGSLDCFYSQILMFLCSDKVWFIAKIVQSPAFVQGKVAESRLGQRWSPSWFHLSNGKKLWCKCLLQSMIGHCDHTFVGYTCAIQTIPSKKRDVQCMYAVLHKH